jgi:hypothetical protein
MLYFAIVLMLGMTLTICFNGWIILALNLIDYAFYIVLVIGVLVFVFFYCFLGGL